MPLRVFFFLAGFAVANWTVRIPAVKDQVGASTTELGLALLCLSIGGVVAMALGGRACLRFGSRRVVIVAGVTTFAALPLPGMAASVPALAAILLLYGASYGLFNIALNSAAVEFERALGRPAMSGLHGLYSAGALGGALTGGAAAGYLTPAAHLGLVALIGLATCAVAGRHLGRGTHGSSTPEGPGPAGTGRQWGVVWIFGVIAFCTAFTEFANNDWAVLHLQDDLGASAPVAAYGYAAYECAITVARLAGNRLIHRFGSVRVLVAGCLLATAGILVAGQTTALELAVAAYLAIGLGVANTFPIAIARSGAIGGPRAVSLVAPLGSVGIMIERPLIGFLADQIGLRNALSAVAILTVVAAGLAIAERLLGRGPKWRREPEPAGRESPPSTTHRDSS